MRPADEQRLPRWFRVGLSTGDTYRRVSSTVRNAGLQTVCERAACPNRNECWNSGTATFLILGDRCTRNCGFCNIEPGVTSPVDPGEPRRVAAAVAALGLSHAVITSVTRDDLPDGGADQFARTIRAIRNAVPGCTVEVLVPDLQGNTVALDSVLDASPEVLNHNIETVPSLYRRVRPDADYGRSLGLLRSAHGRGSLTKSGIMLGLGEEIDEVRSALRDLRNTGCSVVTIGQYLRPGSRNLPVARYADPTEFSALRQEALSIGFTSVLAGPRVRSSYHAGVHLPPVPAGVV